MLILKMLMIRWMISQVRYLPMKTLTTLFYMYAFVSTASIINIAWVHGGYDKQLTESVMLRLRSTKDFIKVFDIAF